MPRLILITSTAAMLGWNVFVQRAFTRWQEFVFVVATGFWLSFLINVMWTAVWAEREAHKAGRVTNAALLREYYQAGNCACFCLVLLSVVEVVAILNR